jgi:anthranilate phosphoribosyltransferase
VHEFNLDPRKFGFDRVETQVLIGGDSAHNADVARQLFAGDTRGNLGAVRDIVLLNAAAGVVAYELAKDASRVDVDLEVRFTDAVERVTSAIDSGAAANKIAEWVAATNSV